MNSRTVPCIGLVLAALILAAGCTGQPVPAAAPETTTVSPPPTPTCSLTPGPIQSLPDYESVSISVERNTISDSPTITTTFNGGKGLGMVQSMTVTLIRSDCITDTQTRKDPGIGTSITQMGTTGTDRVIVVLLMTSGDQFTVVDDDYSFPWKY